MRSPYKAYRSPFGPQYVQVFFGEEGWGIGCGWKEEDEDGNGKTTPATNHEPRTRRRIQEEDMSTTRTT